MSGKNNKSDSPQNARPSNSRPSLTLANSTKMFILPPNIWNSDALKNVRLDRPIVAPANTSAPANIKEENSQSASNSGISIPAGQSNGDIVSEKSKLKKRTVHFASAVTSTPVKDATETTSTNKEETNANLLVSPVSTPKMPRKRGRPRKVPISPKENESVPNTSNLEESLETNNSVTESIANNTRHVNTSYSSLGNDTSDGSDNDKESKKEIETPTAKRRGRPPGRLGPVNKARSRGAGRGKNVSSDTEYIPRGSSKSKGEGQEVDASVPTVTCFKCDMAVPKIQWGYHNISKHNNTSWVKGEEPLDLENDQKLLKKILTAAIKKRRGQLVCEECKAIKRSVIGFLSHMQFCGKTEDERKALLVTCEICGAVMMPSSLEVHERFHKQQDRKKLEAAEEPLNDDLNDLNGELNGDSNKNKRRAATKAITKILEFTESDRLEEGSDAKKMKLMPIAIEDMIQKPDPKKKIPNVWKGIWKRELASNKQTACRHVGCTYTSTSYNDICQHFFDCSYLAAENFVCRVCKFSSTSNDEMVTHIIEEHQETKSKNADYELSSESEPPDEEDVKDDVKQTKKQSHTKTSTAVERSNEKFPMMKFLDREVSCVRWKKPYVPALRWTMEFERKHYVLRLFDDYTPSKFTPVVNSKMDEYMPNVKVSMRMRTDDLLSSQSNDNNKEWKRWKRFESGFDNGVTTFFVGGPVWAIAWLPIPSSMYHKRPAQYIAVSTHTTMEAEYVIGKSYSGQNIIQIWDIGHLENELMTPRKLPKLAYAIAHNHGTIWCFEWCPSGCYEHDYLGNYNKESDTKRSKRIGLLATACSDGNVHIYSLPFPGEVNREGNTDRDWPIYETDPSITLVVNIIMHDKKEQTWQCTKISWSRERGHNTIAAGFTNGYIALWDLNIKSPLTMVRRKNTTFIQAFRHFYAHGHVVSMVSLIPYANGRYLVSGSFDRCYKLWDLENVESSQNCQRKGIITDGKWMTFWPCVALSFDDALSYQHTNSYFFPLREYGYRFSSILPATCTTLSISTSDYGNSIAHGTLSGDVVVNFPHQLMYMRHLEKALQNRKVCSAVKVIDLLEGQDIKDKEKEKKKNPKEYTFMPATYEECKERFGVVYCDKLKDPPKELRADAARIDKLRSIPIEMCPFTSVNRVSWNPNAWSYLWLATGYQNGLVRLLSFNSMAASFDLYKILPRHAEFMLRKRKVLPKENDQ